jgi:hypothetical protein
MCTHEWTTARLRNVLVASIAVPVTMFAAFVALMWWGSRPPRRPADISPTGIFLERGVVPFKFSTHGDWLDCWQDSRTNMDRCKLADENGAVKFEDVFVSYENRSPVAGKDLRINSERTRSLHMGVTGKDVSVPIVFLQNGQILLPQSEYDNGKKFVDFWVYGRGDG